MKRPLSKLALISLLSAAPVLLVTAGAARAADDAAIAKKAKEVCAACHGPDGNTPTGPDFPKIAGQHYDYLLHSLKSYKSGARKNPIMASIVQPLSEQELEGLAEYYAHQQGTLVTKH
jgi:cytochrome c553